MPFFPQFSSLFVAPYIPISTVSPDSVSGLVLWLKADAGVTESSGDVSAWEDQSASGSDATATGTPLYLTNEINGLPAIEFDGSSYLTGANVLSSTDATIFIVAKFADYQSVGMMFEQYDSGDNMAFYRGFGSGGIQRKLRIYNGTDLSGDTATSDNAFYILSTTVNDTDASLYVNGTLDTSGSAGDTTASGDYLLARWEGGDQNTLCTIAEVIVYDNVISESDRTGIENYLNVKYAIY